jgi:hypothetical protein
MAVVVVQASCGGARYGGGAGVGDRWWWWWLYVCSGCGWGWLLTGQARWRGAAAQVLVAAVRSPPWWGAAEHLQAQPGVVLQHGVHSVPAAGGVGRWRWLVGVFVVV